MKCCSKCGILKNYEDFSASKRVNGEIVRFNSWCKLCCKELDRETRKQKGVKSKEIFFYDTVMGIKECASCRQVMCTSSFSPSKRGSCGVSSYCRECNNKRRKVSSVRESSRKATKRYREKNPSKWRAMHRIHQFNRRRLVKATDDGTVTSEFLEKLFTKTNCCWCGQLVQEDKKTIEHIVELSQGGRHSSSNIDMACLSCNSARKGKYVSIGSS